MTRALAGGAALLPGLIGVTRLMETGTPTLVEPLPAFAPEPPLLMMTVTAPVNVPFGRSVGSAKTCSVMPDGGSEPLDGCTVSHGLSTGAGRGKVPPATPGVKSGR